MRRDKSEYSVQAVDNALDILEFLGDAEGEVSVTEISARLNLTKSNVNKLLTTLEHFGYIDMNKYTGNYKLGVKTFQISQAYFNKLNLIDSS
ncbi:MAG: helix-turn-helix domain-containing protein, partial [Deferribacterales bacterium]